MACLFRTNRLILCGTGNLIECRANRSGHMRIYVYENNNYILIEEGVTFKHSKFGVNTMTILLQLVIIIQLRMQN